LSSKIEGPDRTPEVGDFSKVTFRGHAESNLPGSFPAIDPVAAGGYDF